MATQIEMAKTQRRQPVWRDTHQVLRRGDLIGVEDLLRLAAGRGAVGSGDPGPRSELAGAAVAKEMTADDFPVRGHVEAGELLHGQK